MTLPPRILTFQCMGQLFFVVVGFLVTGIFYREPSRWRWSPSWLDHVTSFIQHYGCFFLIVPVCWFVFAARRTDREGPDAPCLGLPIWLAGLILTAALGLLFGLTSLHALHLIGW